MAMFKVYVKGQVRPFAVEAATAVDARGQVEKRKHAVLSVEEVAERTVDLNDPKLEHVPDDVAETKPDELLRRILFHMREIDRKLQPAEAWWCFHWKKVGLMVWIACAIGAFIGFVMAQIVYALVLYLAP